MANAMRECRFEALREALGLPRSQWRDRDDGTTVLPMLDAPPDDWPPDATILGWYAGGSAENPWRAACLWLSVPNPGAPDEDPHLTIRPTWMAPPGVVERRSFAGTLDDDEPLSQHSREREE